MVIKLILVTIMESFPYPKTYLTPKLNADITVSVVKPKQQKVVASWVQWINANLEILHFFPFSFFQWIWFCKFKQTFLGALQSPEYHELFFHLLTHSATCGDQDAVSYSKIYDVTPSFLFCFTFMCWRFGKNTNKLHPLTSSAQRLQSKETLWTKISFLSCLCALPSTLGSWFIFATETLQLCRIMQAYWIRLWRSFDFN